jgi:Pentapeptide repeats (8 copies)
LKFIPDGAGAVPDAALDKAGCADALARPERYQRVWLVAELVRYHKLFALHGRDGPRIYTLEPPVLPPRGELSSRTLEAHLQWVRRGRTGAGRLDIANVDVTGVKVGAKDMSGALLDGVIFDRATVSYSTFERAELTDVRMIQADLRSCSFVGARLLRCDFLGAILVRGKLDYTDCRFHGASGRPARVIGVRIERPDLSPGGDRRVIGRDEDVLALWRGQGVRQ